jgi:hypothetical protein
MKLAGRGMFAGLPFAAKMAGASEVQIMIPVIGIHGDIWPVDCAKVRKIVRAHAGQFGRR